jgi:hypothetical protein
MTLTTVCIDCVCVFVCVCVCVGVWVCVSMCVCVCVCACVCVCVCVCVYEVCVRVLADKKMCETDRLAPATITLFCDSSYIFRLCKVAIMGLLM